MVLRIAFGVFVLALLAAGCEKGAALQDQPAAPLAQDIPKGKPQPKLPTIKLWLGTNVIEAELAATIPQIQTGMMFRTNMAEMEGMLFVFPEPYRTSFWMKNTLVPMTCAYIDSAGVIQELHDMTPLDENPIYAAKDNIQYVLEMNRNWFSRHGVSTGAVVRTPKGSLSQTFFGKP
ncbi:MAG: DUF192 domain-containing protein [Verrucomicrobiota bacterium]